MFCVEEIQRGCVCVRAPCLYTVYNTANDGEQMQMQKMSLILCLVQRQWCSAQTRTHKELCFGWYMVIRLLANLWPEIICGFR